MPGFVLLQSTAIAEECQRISAGAGVRDARCDDSGTIKNRLNPGHYKGSPDSFAPAAEPSSAGS